MSDVSTSDLTEYLKKAQPKDLDASEIDVRLGATWVNRDYIQQFMEETLSVMPRSVPASLAVKPERK